MVDQTNSQNFKKILFFLESYLLPFLFFAQAVNACLNFLNMEYFSVISILNDILRPLTFAVVLFFSSRNVQKHFDSKIALGIGLSYIPFFFLKFSPTVDDGLFEIAAFSLNVFYLIILFGAVFQIRTHFTVLPGFKKLTSVGLYSIVRHPIYSTYLHLAFIYLLISPLMINLILLICIYAGLLLRAQSEESVITRNDITYSDVMPKTRFFHLILTTPLILLFAYKMNIEFQRKKRLVLHVAYPIYSLIPYQADDWSSFFVMNHIYPRFNSRVGIFRSNSIFAKKEVTCAGDGFAPFSEDCAKVQVRFEIKNNLKLCNGQTYSLDDLNKELLQITKTKNWIFPNYRTCGQSCFEFDNVKNIQDHFDSIYLRFGWSKNKNSDKSFGVSPNCFEPSKYDGSSITSGTLHSSEIELKITHDESNSDIVLYGNKPHKKEFKTLDYFNPIFFYLVSRHVLDVRDIESIQKVMLDHKIISTKAHINSAFNNRKKSSKFTIILPNYLDNCAVLQNELISRIGKINFSCSNISIFTERIVKGGKDWDGFISPLTPGMPGKEGIEEQYFNQKSKDNWLGSKPAATNVILLGFMSGSIQVKKNKFCSIKPNSLGLSDITIDDFIACE